MKKMIFLALLALGGASAAHAQRAGVLYGNHTSYAIDVQFYGDVPPGSCTNNYMTIPYTMPSSTPSVVPASSMTWIGGAPVSVINGIRLTYYVSGSPVSSFDYPICGTPTAGPIPFTFPSGGPSLNLNIGDSGTSYGIFVDY